MSGAAEHMSPAVAADEVWDLEPSLSQHIAGGDQRAPLTAYSLLRDVGMRTGMGGLFVEDQGWNFEELWNKGRHLFGGVEVRPRPGHA